MMQYSRKTYNKKKYVPYSKSNETYTYAFHDIDDHKDEILGQVHYWHLENYKYIIPNNNLKQGEVNYPGFDKDKIFVNGKEYKINNKEQYVNEFGIAMNPIDCNEFKYSIVEVK